MEAAWPTAALWMGLALAASLFSVRLGLSIALAEIVAGVIGGNFLGIHPNEWINWLGGFGSVLLTFLAGADIDPESLRRTWKPSLALGLVGFAFPFAGALAFTRLLAHWNLPAAEIAGLALSTTSVAVVYAVLVETGLNRRPLGKRILAACFVNDLGTVIGLGVLFAGGGIAMWMFVAATAAAVAALPILAPRLLARYGNQVSQPAIKALFLLLFALGALAVRAGSEPVLPAYVLGLAAAGAFATRPEVMERMRAIAFALLTPFYFLKAGLYVSLPAAAAGWGIILSLFGVKMAAKLAGVGPATRILRMGGRPGNYTTLLMSTGLTFGTISSLYGLTHGLIDQAQYTVLVTVVIASAVVPTIVAQTFFRPKEDSTISGGEL